MKKDYMTLAQHITSGISEEILKNLYGDTGDLKAAKERYEEVIARLFEQDPSARGKEVSLYSVPGRTELGGNHTDHNHGKVLASSVNLDVIAAVIPRDDDTVIIDSKGFPTVEVDLSVIRSKDTKERHLDGRLHGMTEALALGVGDAFLRNGLHVGGFHAVTVSNIPKGAGLSSSAAIEILIGSIFNSLYNNDCVDALTLARYGQYAENLWFGKPSGLMDQAACAYGGMIGIDFKDPENPLVTPLDFSFRCHDYTLVVVDTGGSHADLTSDYAAIREDMGKIARYFGVFSCREVTHVQLQQAIHQVRVVAGDRAVSRVLHYLAENERVENMIRSVREDHMGNYLSCVRGSGHSSGMFLQNTYSLSTPEEQGITVALALTELFLQGEGACRVHGGGFAGTIQAYVPVGRSEMYKETMEKVFTKGSVTELNIRSLPAGRIL